LIAFRHSALGFISGEHKAGMNKGWASMHERVRRQAEAGWTTARIAIDESQVKSQPMCPVCLTTAMLIAVSATSTGGLAAFAIKKFGVKNAVDNHPAPTPSKEDDHG